MDDALRELYTVALSRKRTPAEGSYTCYLFREGLDKILKKCGEECAETIIAAKNLAAAEAIAAAGREETACGRADRAAGPARARADLENELCDLLYHLLVLMAERDIPLENIESILRERSKKIGNLKQPRAADRDT
ncbi:MAG: phosphoribosyl-ATP diphosphatase [Clostridiales Family XIII bacterium]|jgi:phosphoribosyl-ATP pyrophosphohydrolase|nr:phosphoribosyl-ATP diphosphatase [Clostridiales Family XIII bacterium]